jgi:(1->4)-alpha-D-glucan 1-alpha-D-glucosylmutase
LTHWRDGAIKQAVIARLLATRREHPELFARGSYRALAVEGPASEHVLAFVREHRGQRLFIAVARHTAEWIAGSDAPAIGADHWEGTSLTLPDGRWMSVFGEGRVDGGPIEAATLFGELPVAAWLAQRAS